MKERTFNVIVIAIIIVSAAGLVFAGYNFKKCPQCTPCPERTVTVTKVDTIYREKIRIIKEQKHETNPYIVNPPVYVSIFDSITKYYCE